MSAVLDDECNLTIAFVFPLTSTAKLGDVIVDLLSSFQACPYVCVPKSNTYLVQQGNFLPYDQKYRFVRGNGNYNVALWKQQ
jgi:hypothetical protein